MSERIISTKAQLSRYEAVVIGASAGGVEVLMDILPALPSGYPLPVIIVLHLPSDQRSLLVELFNEKCRMNVQEAEDKIELRGGTIYFAPPGYHILIESDRRLSLSCDAPVMFSRPSINVLFESAADVYGQALVGLVLTGANSDGAQGLKAICLAGGAGIVQAPAQAFVPAMPEAALATCPAARPMSVQEITAFLLQCVNES